MAMRLSSTESGSKAKTRNSSSADDLTQVIKNQFDDPRVCKRNLENKLPLGASFDFVENAAGVRVFEKNKTYEGVKIKDFLLRGGGNDGTFTVPGDYGFTNVEVVFEWNQSSSKVAVVKKRFPIWVKLTGANLIESCGSVNLLLNSFWLRSFTDPMNITYQAGNVGVNTSSPTLGLDVQGVIRASSTAGEPIILGEGPANRFRLELLVNKAFTLTELGASPGDVFVRGLITTRQVRPTGSVSCAAGTEGSTRYNTGIRRLELCVKDRGVGYTWIHFLE